MRTLPPRRSGAAVFALGALCGSGTLLFILWSVSFLNHYLELNEQPRAYRAVLESFPSFQELPLQCRIELLKHGPCLAKPDPTWAEYVRRFADEVAADVVGLADVATAALLERVRQFR